MKKKALLFLVMSGIFCSTLSTIAYSTAFDDVLVKYCVPKSSNNCLATSEKATYTTDGCSCPVGRYYEESERKCKECPEGSFKETAGVGKCISILCPGGTYLNKVSACGFSEYKKLIY
ncbi:hypothetical protein HDR60_03825 [bacterium]|nr:hypothetical protein [bacterium]